MGGKVTISSSWKWLGVSEYGVGHKQDLGNIYVILVKIEGNKYVTYGAAVKKGKSWRSRWCFLILI